MPGKSHEITFQDHITAYLNREHGYPVLEQSEITDRSHFIAEDHLWAFLTATQKETLDKLTADYGTDARDEIFKALRTELLHTPLWILLRHGLKVRGLDFRLFYPKPRSSEIVALEVKHEKNQTVHDAVAQFIARDHKFKIFQYPFLYLVADTSDVMAATDPRKEQNFRWYNTGLTNKPINKGEYPVEFLYREVLSKEQLLDALSFFLIYVPKRDTEEDKPERPAFTLFPRYHQSRMVRKLSDDIVEHFTATGDIGRKYLINHSAGSGKTLSICWLADRLHSLFKTGTNEKLVDLIFILTDRKSLDKNIKDEIENFTHLKDVIGLAKKSDDLPRFLKDRRPIIVTTQQKFEWVLEKIQENEELKNLRVAFLIDEAHRSQEGKMGAAIRMPFRNGETPDKDEGEEDEEERIARIIQEHDLNQLFVAFTATPAPATLTMFGEPFDIYSESEAIAEGYILDVAASIISYKTLYHLHCPVVPKGDEEKIYPAGVVAKALKNVAFQDDGLIQYKAEVMLRIFEENVKGLIDGRAKAMIVASSRVAGLRYFEIIKEKIRERNADYKVLYAFSDFVHPKTNAAISEHAINELKDGEQIEDRFEGNDYRLMVVANKFLAGFDQPLLAGMFLDKPVVDRNAVQTVSRLNRCYAGKKGVVVVDFTNNARAILKAFARYRKGTPFEPEEPDKEQCLTLYTKILSAGVFTQEDAHNFVKLISNGSDAQVQFTVNALRSRFQARIIDLDERKAFVYLLARFVKSYHFLTCFFAYSDEIKEFVAFSEYVGGQLIKQGNLSDLMKLVRKTEVTKAAVQYQGEVHSGGKVKLKSGKGSKGSGPPIMKVSVQDMIATIRGRFQITDEEALYIKEVTEEKEADPAIGATVHTHREDWPYLEGAYRVQVNGEIQNVYGERGRYDELADLKYIDIGGIFDIMAITVIQHHLVLTA
jgi:type I restriction enzyme R subunit